MLCKRLRSQYSPPPWSSDRPPTLRLPNPYYRLRSFSVVCALQLEIEVIARVLIAESEEKMFGSSNPFGQSSSSPFGSQSVFGQTSSTNNSSFAPKPSGSTTPFGAQTGSIMSEGTSTSVFGGANQASSPFPSSTTFGAASSPAFGNTTPAFGATSSPSPLPFGGSSWFGQNPVFGAIGSNPTQTSPFGSTTQPSQPAFGSSIFCSSTPFGGSSQPAFGATTTPAFGAISTPAFGAISSPAFGTTTTPAFGATTTPAFGATSTSAFGATSSPAFGSTTSPTFGSTKAAFGVSSSPLFGSGGAFRASSTLAFGSSSSTFGTSSNPTFGASGAPGFGSSSTLSFSFPSTPTFAQSSSTFGSNQFAASSLFGAQSSPFGAQSTTFGNTDAFGHSAFGGQQRGGSRVVAYATTPELDGGTGTSAAGKWESISAMPAYKEKSHEELRWEDYQLGDKGGPAFVGGSGFGITTSQPNPLNLASTFPQASSPFNATTSCNLFAPKTSSFINTGFTTSTPFSSSSFGISTSTSPFTPSQPSTVFPQTSCLSLFSSSSSAFSFSASSPFPSSTTFGATSSPAFGNTTPAFGATSSPSPSRFGAWSLGASGFGSTSTPSLCFLSTPASSPLGAQSSLFRAQSTTFGNTSAFGQSTFGGQQCGGSRVVAYVATPEPDGGTGTSATGKLESISAMPAYKEKSHEELRWEDYQLGDKGGPAPAGGSGFGITTSQPNPLNLAPTFPQASSPFNATTSSNLFAPKTSSFTNTGFTTSTPFSSSCFGISTSTSPFTPSQPSTVFPKSSPPFLFGSSSFAFSFSYPAATSSSIFNSNPFNPTLHAAPTSQTSGAFTSPFGLTTTSFSQPFSNPSFGGQQFGGNIMVAYAATPEPDGGSGKFESISAMPAYKEKSHEELRWEQCSKKLSRRPLRRCLCFRRCLSTRR